MVSVTVKVRRKHHPVAVTPTRKLLAFLLPFFHCQAENLGKSCQCLPGVADMSKALPKGGQQLHGLFRPPGILYFARCPNRGVEASVEFIMSQSLTFQSHSVRVHTEGEQVMFVVKDVCLALGISWSGSKILSGIPDSWKGVVKLPTPRGGVQKFVVINEAGMYKLAFRSNKPEADAFTNWVASEVLPAIRKTGKYEAAPKAEQLALPAPASGRRRGAPAYRTRMRRALRYRRMGLSMREIGMLTGCRHQEISILLKDAAILGLGG